MGEVLTVKQVVNWIVAFTTPIFLAHSSYGVYFLFGGSCLCTAAVCMAFMPETRGRTLEDIDASFRMADAHVLNSCGSLHSELESKNVISSVVSSVVV